MKAHERSGENLKWDRKILIYDNLTAVSLVRVVQAVRLGVAPPVLRNAGAIAAAKLGRFAFAGKIHAKKLAQGKILTKI